MIRESAVCEIEVRNTFQRRGRELEEEKAMFGFGKWKRFSEYAVRKGPRDDVPQRLLFLFFFFYS